MLYAVALLGGIAGLTWELLWMHYTALSLGVSARGAALTLVAFSLGMAVGALASGRFLRRRDVNAVHAWGVLEVGLGLLGQTLAPGFAMLAGWDAELFATSPGTAGVAQVVGILAVLAAPAACMGATIPVFAAVAKGRGVSIAWLYASNVAGAAIGIVLATFVFVPGAGVGATVDLASSVDLGIGLLLIVVARRATTTTTATATTTTTTTTSTFSFRTGLLLVGATGFATFALEVAWFRSLRAAFQATTESFALVLCAVLVALSVGGALAPRLRRSGRVRIEAIAAGAAVAVLLSTPLVERTDLIALTFVDGTDYTAMIAGRLGLALLALGPSMLLIGIILPWCFEAYPSTAHAARLYAANTGGAVAGSLLAAWVLLPTIGFARTAWLAAGVLAIAGLVASAPERRRLVAGVVLGAVVLAWVGASDVGRLRAQINGTVAHEVLAVREGPDATVSVIEHEGGTRFLVIDGFHATGTGTGEHYMAWMGHLPMIMHPDPKRALVICFGTGQTANAVRKENPEHLDIIDVSPSVFAMADWFPDNEGVLDDPRVEHRAMDGRAWLRRTDRQYDVITLEPMPPTFAGSNALYSKEFYGLVAARLSPDGVAAQWLPFHLVDPEESASITATFLAVFPESFLWVDRSGTGILLGRMPGAEGRPLWPGMGRPVERNLPPEGIAAAVYAGPPGLTEYAKLGEVITDDNQRLSYGFGRTRWWRLGRGIEDTIRYQHQLLDAMARPGDTDDKLAEFMAKHPHPGR